MSFSEWHDEVMPLAKGEFDVQVIPREPEDPAVSIGRMVLDKKFHGDLQAASKGQMLAAGTSVPGSAGYVAMEIVSGTLNGRTGTFVLQHLGIMNRGTPHLEVTVVPDSATAELTGLAGKMTIQITGGKHFYEFDYSLDM